MRLNDIKDESRAQEMKEGRDKHPSAPIKGQTYVLDCKTIFFDQATGGEEATVQEGRLGKEQEGGIRTLRCGHF